MGQQQIHFGLALGGGAAKGWAHIGFMKALDANQIRPDVIAGTSIGAVVAGCWAAGQLDRLEDFARSLTKRKVFSLLDISFTGSGLISGSRLASLLERDLEGVLIEDLSVPFTCLASDYETGAEVWLSSGVLATAIRASYALPGIFHPIKIDDKWLLDGAMANPVPVSVCRSMGAKYVAAVNLSTQTNQAPNISPLPQEDEDVAGKRGARHLIHRQLMGQQKGAPSISSVLMQSFGIMSERLARSRLAGDPPESLITPDTNTIGIFDFHRADEAIEIGYDYGMRFCEKHAAAA